MSEGSDMHLQTQTNPFVAPEGSTNAIRSGYGPKYGAWSCQTAKSPPPARATSGAPPISHQETR